MRSVHTGPVIGLITQLALLAALAATVGLGGPGWVVGVASALIINVGLARGLARHDADGLHAANWVTLARATLVGGVAALIADSFDRTTSTTTLVSLAVLALVLDAVDGWVARRTHTVSTLGARFDMEVDAFLILVLSVYVARSSGAWVLAIGLARYAYYAAGWLLPWLRETVVPPRYWCKVVAAITGIVLTVAAADVLARPVIIAALAISLALLAESFGHEGWWLWRHRGALPSPIVAADRPLAARRGARIATPVITVLAGLLLWFALVAPNELSRLTPMAFLRIPIEGLVLVGVMLVLPLRARRIVVPLVGVALGLLAILKILDMGFFAALGRPFHPVIDWSYLGSLEGLLTDSLGRRGAIISLSAAGALCVALLIFMPLSLRRVTRVVDRHRAESIRAVTAIGVVWVVCAAFGLQIVAGAPLASTSAASLAFGRVSQVRTDIRDERQFAKTAGVDPYQNTPGSDLLTGLRGKDVIVAVIESYGRVAVQDSSFSPGVDAVLDAGTKRLSAAGFSSQSAFLTSPTFGGISWLAHSTLQSGLWINNQLRYNDLLNSNRFTLARAFNRAGWRTVDDVPSNTKDWPAGKRFYDYDKIYDSRNVGYAGPRFSYSAMPDQYTLSAFQRNELAKPDRKPVMAEIDLTSSHTPWAPLPRMVDPSAVGDGSVYDPMPQQGQSPGDVWPNPGRVQATYGQSVQYSLNALFDFVQNSHDDNLVLVVYGDHQPAAIVSGPKARHDVPISIIAHDPTVMKDISGWGWQDGMRPGPDAPLWRMDAFRNRFLAAYGPQPAPSTPPPAAAGH